MGSLWFGLQQVDLAATQPTDLAAQEGAPPDALRQCNCATSKRI
jgi:hypothetical protein